MRRQGDHIVSNHTARSGSTGNLFLDTLPAPSAERLLPELMLSHVVRGQMLSEPGVPMNDVYFPLRSLLSTVTIMGDGSAVEVGIAGHEGMSSLAIAFGSRTSPHSTMVQIADSAYSIDAEFFAHQIETDVELRARIASYAQYVFVAATQFAACNRLHQMEGRYARWLLMADDRCGRGEFTLTQEYSAQMLGVRRAGVTVVAGEMSNAGLITYRRGHVTVLDRDGLVALSCECYGVVNAELKRLMGYDFETGTASTAATGRGERNRPFHRSVRAKPARPSSVARP